MRPSPVFALALVAVIPWFMPRAAHSKYFRTEAVGNSWRKTGNANAYLMVSVSSDAPRPLYVEAILPLPDGSAGKPIRKTVSSTESRIDFEGPVLSGWKVEKTYVFRLRAYADPGYTKMADSLEQRSVCIKPPEKYLKQLKDE
jgi:hypothetical protein